MAPKSWAITHPERSAVLLARPFRAFTLLVRPFLHLLNGAANGFLRLFGVRAPEDHGVSHSAAELAVLLAESTQTGTIESDDAELLSRALALSGLTAESAMVPARRDRCSAGERRDRRDRVRRRPPPTQPPRRVRQRPRRRSRRRPHARCCGPRPRVARRHDRRGARLFDRVGRRRHAPRRCVAGDATEHIATSPPCGATDD